MKLRYRSIFPFCAVHVALPVLVFVTTWLRLAFGIVMGVLGIVALVFAIRHARGKHAVFWPPADGGAVERSKKRSERECGGEQAVAKVTPLMLVGLAVIALVWCVLSGQGGFWYQSEDWGARNAIFRDLITYAWPVVYNDGAAAMSYYIAYWLPAALPGHLLYSVGISLDTVWALSNVLLLIWTTIGVFLVELLVVCVLRPSHAWGVFACVFALMFFSTPDVVGMLFTGRISEPLANLHLEWWALAAQISSITTCLMWVFNQTVIPWICTLCFLQERSLGNYVFLGVCCFASGPLPCVGLFVLMLVVGLSRVIMGARTGEALRRLRSIATVQNAISLVLACVFVSFFLVNAAVNSTSTIGSADNLLTYPLWFPADVQTEGRLAAFVVIEGLILPLLIAKDHWRNPLFWTVALTLCLVAFVRVGSLADFCMRASVPAVVCLYVMCMQSLRGARAALSSKRGARRVANAVCLAALSIVLLLGAATPAMEFLRGFYIVSHNDWCVPTQDWGTMATQDFSTSNFGSTQYRDTLFFKYLA